MNLQVKIGTIADLADIVSFQRNMALETENLSLDKETLTAGVRAVINDSAKGKYYLVEQDGKNIACLLTTFEWSEWRNGTVLWIQSVYVVPPMRNKGIFSILYKHVKELVQHDDSLKGIRLYADKTNTNAHKVYENIGMTSEHYQLYEWLK